MYFFVWYLRNDSNSVLHHFIAAPEKEGCSVACSSWFWRTDQGDRREISNLTHAVQQQENYISLKATALHFVCQKCYAIMVFYRSSNWSTVRPYEAEGQHNWQHQHCRSNYLFIYFLKIYKQFLQPQSIYTFPGPSPSHKGDKRTGLCLWGWYIISSEILKYSCSAPSKDWPTFPHKYIVSLDGCNDWGVSHCTSNSVVSPSRFIFLLTSMDFQVQAQGAAAGAMQFHMQRAWEEDSGGLVDVNLITCLQPRQPTQGYIKKGMVSRETEVVIPLCSPFIRPHMEHCIQARGPQYKNNTELLEEVQKRPWRRSEGRSSSPVTKG